MTSAGVMIGTASVVLMVAVGFGMERSVTQQFEQYAIATDIQVSSAGMGEPTPEAAAKRDRKSPVLDDDAVREFEKLPATKAVMPRIGMGATMFYKDYAFGQQFYAVDMRRLEKWGAKLDSGRFPTGPNEVLAGYAVPVIMLAKDGAITGDPTTGNQPRLDLLDKQVKIEFQGVFTNDGKGEPPPPVTKKLRVVGILKKADFNQDMTVFVPLKTAERYAGLDIRRVEYQELTVRAKKVSDVEQLAKDITAMGFQAFSPGAEMGATQGIFRIIQLVLGAIGGIALLVASIGIANTMTMATYERTREIGIMKAVGASGGQVRRMFLVEAAVIGLLGGIGGLLVAMAAAGLGNLLVAGLGTGPENPFSSGGGLFYIPVPLALFAVAFSAVVGLVAGTLPAVRAANLDPLAALRHE